MRIDGADFGNELSASCNEGQGKLQQHRRRSRRSRDRPVELLPKRRLVAEVLRPAGEYRHIAQLQGAGDMLQKRALPGVRLQQGELDLWQRQRKGYGRQATAAADVDHAPDPAPRNGPQRGGVLELRLDLLEGSCSRQVDGAIPVEQQLRVPLKGRAHNLTIWSCRSTSSPVLTAAIRSTSSAATPAATNARSARSVKARTPERCSPPSR